MNRLYFFTTRRRCFVTFSVCIACAIASAVYLLASTGPHILSRFVEPSHKDPIESVSPILLAAKARSLFEQERFVEASTVLRKAVAAAEGDRGYGNENLDDSCLSDDALRHGEVQIRQMLSDRPAMARRANPDGLLWKWAVRKFAGEDAGMLLDWNSKDPTPFDGNLGGGESSHAWIQIRELRSDNPELNCDVEWSRAVCQLFSTAARKEQLELARRAMLGELSCDAFVSARLFSEELARQRTRSFYLEHYLPSLNLASMDTSPAAWHCFEFYSDTVNRVATWRGTARWNFHADWFELLSATGANGRRDDPKVSRCLASLESTRARLTSEQLGALHYTRAHQYENRNDLSAALTELKIAQHFSPASILISDERARVLHRAASAEQIAVADLDRLIKQEPESPVLYAARARLYFQKKEFDLGSRDIFDAIQLHPGDVGQNYEPNTEAPLSAEALLHGEAQIKAMLRDRPAMAESITEGDELWTWTVRKFAGEDGELVDWSPASPAPHEARCVPAIKSQRAQINVRYSPMIPVGGKSEEFNRLWAYAVFELHNLTHAGKSSEITRQAWQGTMDRDTYVTTMLEREQFAVQSARAFFLKKYLPFMRAKAVSASPDIWHCFTFFPSEAARNAHWKATGHWDYYGSYYDKLVAHRVQASQGQLFGLPAVSQGVTSGDLVRQLSERESAPQTIETLILPSQAIGNITLPEPSPQPHPGK